MMPENVRRTQKTKDLSHKDWAEACWYFPDSREQYRLQGHLTLIGKDSSDKELSEVQEISLRFT